MTYKLTLAWVFVIVSACGTPNQFIFRIEPMPPELLQRAKSEPRMDLETRTPGAKWFTFELGSSADLRDALWWLNQAYERAK